MKGFHPEASNDDSSAQNYADQTTESSGNVSADTAIDTTAPKSWTIRHYVECSDVIDGQGFLVARVGSIKGLEALTPLDGIRANAHLIASAPELYEALEASVAWYRYCLEFMSWLQFPELEAEVMRKLAQALDALAKARGVGND